MENIVETIVNMDKKARDMLERAEKTQEKSRVYIEERKREMYNKYDESLKEIVEMTIYEEEVAIQNGKNKINQRAETVMRVLDETFEANKGLWVSNIVKEVTGEK